MDIGIAKAKDSFSELIDRAEQGEVVTITRHGRPVATLNPARKPVDEQAILRAFAELRKINFPKMTDEEIVACVKADRRF